MMGEYQRGNAQYLKSKSKKSINKLQYSYKSLEAEDYKIFKKYILKLRKKLKYNLITFFQSKSLLLKLYI
jgi:hypothetical protein